MIANLYPRRYNRHFTTAGKKWWAHAYTVSLEGAEKILKNNTPIALSGDRSLMYSVMNGDVTLPLMVGEGQWVTSLA